MLRRNRQRRGNRRVARQPRSVAANAIYTSQPVVQMHLKWFTDSTNNTLTVGTGALLGSLLICGDVASKLYNGLFQSVRLRRVVFHAEPNNGGDMTTFAVKYPGYDNAHREITASGSQANPVNITFVPNEREDAGRWHSQTGINLFTMMTDANLSHLSVDIWFDAVLMDGDAAAYTVTGRGVPSAGYLYTNCLDNSNSGGTIAAAPYYLPIGRTQVL